MSTFATPVPPGAALLRQASPGAVPAGTPALRFEGDPVLWVGLPAGTVIAAFATGCVFRTSGLANGLPGTPAAAWTAFQLSPLPQMDPAAFKSIAAGLPVQMVLIAGDGDASPVSDDLLAAGATLATAPAGDGATAFLGFAFQDRLCRDPLGAAEAIAASNACDANWPGFLLSLAAPPFGRTLRVLDHRGAPMAGIAVSVAVDGNPAQLVTLVDGMNGDTGIMVPAAGSATLAVPGLPHAVLASDGEVGAFGATLVLPPGGRVAQVLDADAWFAEPELGVSLPRWYPDSHVEPIQDGTPYFKRLVDDLRAAKGAGGAAQIAGWAVVKGALEDSSVDWTLVPDDATTTLLALVQELRGAGSEVRMLLNQFITFDKPPIDDFEKFLPILFAVYAALSPLQALAKLNTDPAGYVVGFVAVAALTLIASTDVPEDLVKSVAELSSTMKDALDAIDPTIATWTPYPAGFADNPLVAPGPFKILGNEIHSISHVGVYHQKHVTIRPSGGGDPVAYLGGIDLNSDRIDTPLHRARHPFHDIQVRITGPAVEAVQKTYAERATVHGGAVAIAPGSAAPPPGASHLVQVARTYYKPAVAPGLFEAFAPHGESTPVRTIKAAIGQARDFIYIEDQYFTPPDDYVQALVAAASSSVRALMITVPFATDQPFGQVRRAQVFAALTAAWGARLHIGAPLRRFLHEVPGLTNNLGRVTLTAELGASASVASVGPPGRLPKPPFWAFIGNELVLVHDIPGAPTSTEQGVEMVRAPGAGGWGAKPVKHPAGTPVLAVQLPGIYVHAKMMIIDDVFLSVGSSNLNRRGFYHDGELDSFTVPQHLRGDPHNPVRVLRSRLMAEHLGLSTEMGQALFADPHSALPYFASRSWYEQSRWRKLDFFGSIPPDVPIGIAGSMAAFFLKASLGPLEEAAKPDVWRLLSDPTTGTDPDPTSTGPNFP